MKVICKSENQNSKGVTYMNIGKYAELLGQLFEPAYIVDSQRTILFWNNAAEKMTGYKASTVFRQKCCDNIMMHINDKGEKLCMKQCPLVQVINENEKKEIEFYLQHQDGHRIPVEARFIPISNDDGVVIGAIEVFTKKEQVDESSKPSIIKELIKAAYIDSITNLPNKEYMTNKIKKLLHESVEKPSEVSLGLLAIEVQNLRDFNNLGGTAAGNSLLKVIAQTLSANVEMEAGSFVCKWYGGLFVVIMNSNKISTLANWANKLKILLENSNVQGYEEEMIKLAVGGIATQPGENTTEVLKRLEDQLQVSKVQSDGISIA